MNGISIVIYTVFDVCIYLIPIFLCTKLFMCFFLHLWFFVLVERFIHSVRHTAICIAFVLVKLLGSGTRDFRARSHCLISLCDTELTARYGCRSFSKTPTFSLHIRSIFIFTHFFTYFFYKIQEARPQRRASFIALGYYSASSTGATMTVSCLAYLRTFQSLTI